MTKVSRDPTKVESAPVQRTWPDRLLALLLGYSKLLALLLIMAFAVVSWGDIRALIPRISHFEALGLKIEVSQLEQALRKSAKAANVTLQPSDLSSVLARALKVQAVFEGATILWLDDEPANNLPFRQLLRRLGAGVEPARSTKEALEIAAREHFDLVISDIRRKDENGVEGLAQLRAYGVTCPAIFYVIQVDPTKPTPLSALGITNRPDELLHLVIDGLERARWSKIERAAEQPRAPDRRKNGSE